MKRVKRILKQLLTHTVYDIMSSPVGNLLILATDNGLHAILWQHELESNVCAEYLKIFQRSDNHQIVAQSKKQLTEYFYGARKCFDVPLCIDGTAFQKQVWNVLLSIPFAKTISYSGQARTLGDKNKARAVGMANGLNPISIIIPCHRVIGSNGSLTGFGGGLEGKAWLLNHENKINLGDKCASRTIFSSDVSCFP